MSKAHSTLALAAAAATAATAACDGFVDERYRGAPLARVSGVIVNERVDPAPLLDVAILWYALGPDPYQPATPILLDSSVPVAPQFPSGFELELHTPPVGAISSFPIATEVEEAEGIIALVARKTEGKATAADEVALDERFALLYLDGDLTPTSEQARVHCGPLAAGYHLMERLCDAENGCTAPPTYPAEGGDECGNWTAADGLETVVTLHLR